MFEFEFDSFALLGNGSSGSARRHGLRELAGTRRVGNPRGTSHSYRMNAVSPVLTQCGAAMLNSLRPAPLLLLLCAEQSSYDRCCSPAACACVCFAVSAALTFTDASARLYFMRLCRIESYSRLQWRSA